MRPRSVTDPWSVVRYIQAGHQIIADLAQAVESERPPGTEVMCFRCNVDYGGLRTTWGSHESYLHRMSPAALQSQIVPHLVSRIIYTGAGGFNPLSSGLEFTLSPRVAHINRVASADSTSDRGIFHTKNEPLSRDGYNRLHIICGESLCSETAMFLKAGTTALIVAMADAGVTSRRRSSDRVAARCAAHVCRGHDLQEDRAHEELAAAHGHRDPAALLEQGRRTRPRKVHARVDR